ncbi:unnamed protein product [Caenorhabditis auriculariae]|uniref:Uncharacterized protein n=1 Tax=Caenorhabditis auriculariae TaxID=2777116 RepID=A0A8S1HFH2_9PELO|nr:unnamed protein product [Caenorhabditis auriculariae]
MRRLRRPIISSLKLLRRRKYIVSGRKRLFDGDTTIQGSFVQPTGSDLRHLVALLLDGVSARLPCGSASALTGLASCQRVSDVVQPTGSDLRHLVALLRDGVSARLPCGSASALAGLASCQKVCDVLSRIRALRSALF